VKVVKSQSSQNFQVLGMIIGPEDQMYSDILALAGKTPRVSILGHLPAANGRITIWPRDRIVNKLRLIEAPRESAISARGHQIKGRLTLSATPTRHRPAGRPQRRACPGGHHRGGVKHRRESAHGGSAAAARPGLAVIATAQLMVTFDATIVNVALPRIQTALGFTGGNLERVVNAYALAFGGLLLLGGRSGDLLGRRRIFIACCSRSPRWPAGSPPPGYATTTPA
jgi:hypothetical protein